jgi:hypothetical protein
MTRRERNHALCTGLIEDHRQDGSVVVPVTVAVEVDYLLRSRGGVRAARAFLSDLEAGRLQPEGVGPDVLARACRLDRQYADADIGLVDASVVAIAIKLRADAILTLDHEHFELIRELPCPLLPERSSIR